ncbi:hypothetical protein [Saccharibacter floricola]|uniref:Uncharacterized protein n=1 Tax=Saccharibacter floricola DSM 15669 TaxID=1123227 RepID=A0ABQ0P176_9PROT|nr:hypothetical protein [Saccharibacter floricola]GBQ08917.1 hypothetical protein AA15669_1962 [Saccharibacter floricola DSM 15669]
MTFSNVLTKVAPLLSSILEPAFGGLFHKYGAVAETAVRSAITKSDNGLNALVAVYRHYDETHPLVQTAISEAQSLLKMAGLNAPDADGLAMHIRAAIHDLASAFVSLEGSQAAAPVLAETQNVA